MSKAITVNDVADIGEKLCQIDVDVFSGLLSLPAVVGIMMHPHILLYVLQVLLYKYVFIF